MENSFFEDHFDFQVKSDLFQCTQLLWDIIFFLLFYFIRNFAPLRTIELSGSNFRIKNWSLYVDLRFPPLNYWYYWYLLVRLTHGQCRWFIKICSFSFFRIRSAIAQQISSHFRRYKTTFRVWIRVELDVQLYLRFALCVISMQEPTPRDRNFHRTHRNRRQMIST